MSCQVPRNLLPMAIGVSSGEVNDGGGQARAVAAVGEAVAAVAQEHLHVRRDLGRGEGRRAARAARAQRARAARAGVQETCPVSVPRSLKLMIEPPWPPVAPGAAVARRSTRSCPCRRAGRRWKCCRPARPLPPSPVCQGRRC